MTILQQVQELVKEGRTWQEAIEEVSAKEENEKADEERYVPFTVNGKTRWIQL